MSIINKQRIWLLTTVVFATSLLASLALRTEISTKILTLKSRSTQNALWNPEQLKVIQGFSLKNLSKTQSFRILGKEVQRGDAIYRLGESLFFDTNLSHDSKTACATCHQQDRAFSSSRIVETDGGGPRSVPSLLGVRYSKYFFWDGRADSLWSQAIGPLTAPNEHNLSIADVARRVAQHHAKDYQLAFGEEIPKSIQHIDTKSLMRHFKNILTSIAAFVAFILPQEAKIDLYIESLGQEKVNQAPLFTDCETAGLVLFIGRGQCSNCHFGPLLTNHFFQNVGVPPVSETDKNIGFANRFGMRVYNPWRCELHSPEPESECSHVLNMEYQGALVHSFKTPTLRAIAQTAPYGHNGAFKSLEAVVDHYSQPNDFGVQDFDIVARDFTPAEKESLVCFLKTL